VNEPACLFTLCIKLDQQVLKARDKHVQQHRHQQSAAGSRIISTSFGVCLSTTNAAVVQFGPAYSCAGGNMSCTQTNC
jgi:hypothetical protein